MAKINSRKSNKFFATKFKKLDYEIEDSFNIVPGVKNPKWIVSIVNSYFNLSKLINVIVSPYFVNYKGNS